MSLVPSIKASAQARLKLYQLMRFKLDRAERRLIEANPALWPRIIGELESSVLSSSIEKSDQMILTQIFVFIEQRSKEGLQKQIKFLTGKELWIGRHPTNLLQLFIEEQLRLIKSVQTEQLDKIALVIKRGIREGRLTKDIAKEIQQITGISKKRARLIATNSTLTYSGAITKQNQIEAGFTKYKWQTSNDERVRNSHKERDGKIFLWTVPGPHPRSEINCRCDAIPVLE
jgi:SPP1 gp7 family putative phage head morphogenesis protein